MWGSGLVLSKVLHKLRLLAYNTGSKASIATTALMSESKANYFTRTCNYAALGDVKKRE